MLSIRNGRSGSTVDFLPAELDFEIITDYAMTMEVNVTSAENLLRDLQAFWPDENIHATASRECISLRLGLMQDRLPKGDVSDEQSLVLLIEAESPSLMVLESTCLQLEGTRKQFPLPIDILPVLCEQKRLWARRMTAVDVDRIKQLSNELQAARQEQHAIFEGGFAGPARV